MLSLGATDPIEGIVTSLISGGVVLLPTDTVYGLAIHPDFAEAKDRVYSLKRRPNNMNLPIMVSSAEELELLGFDVNKSATQLLRSPLIPGSVTIAMGFRAGSRPRWLEGRLEAAVRIPKDNRLLSILKRTGPLLVTSANSHGVETPQSLSDVLAQLDGQPDVAIDGGILHTIPSTLVNCRLDPPLIERIGAISESEIMEYLK